MRFYSFKKWKNHCNSIVAFAVVNICFCKKIFQCIWSKLGNSLVRDVISKLNINKTYLTNKISQELLKYITVLSIKNCDGSKSDLTHIINGCEK